MTQRCPLHPPAVRTTHATASPGSWCILVLAWLILGFCVVPVQALRFYVDGSLDGNGDDRRSVQSAQSAATPFRTITHALRIAHLVTQGRPHTIQIAAGTYSASMGETLPFTISQADIYLEPSGSVVLDGEGRSGILRLIGPGGEHVVRNFAMMNGAAAQGGAIYVEDCALRVEDCRFFNNRATSGGHVLHAVNSWVRFIGCRTLNSGPGPGAVLEFHGDSADTSQISIVRNNTFYRPYATAILAAGERLDIDSNIFLNTADPVVMDACPSSTPWIRYNLFHENEILLVDEQADSIKLARTVRDTITLDEQGVVIPDFVTGVPDTIATVGELYEYVIPVAQYRQSHSFKAFVLPAGASVEMVDSLGIVHWTPALADTGRNDVRVEIITPGGTVGYLQYFIHVFSAQDYPDPPGPVVRISFVPDTTGALAALGDLRPSFAIAASSGGNVFASPAFLDTMHRRFELRPESPALNAGNPIVSLRDPLGAATSSGDTRRNNMGHTGGPQARPAPAPDTTYTELNITSLPDSVVTEGQEFVYDPQIENGVRAMLVDIIPGFRAPTMGKYTVFGKAPPITWVPTLADTGTYLIGVITYAQDRTGRHFFPLRVKPLNERPVFTSQADTLAPEKTLYSYQAAASDANGDTLTYSLIAGPQGMRMDAVSGLLTWTPTQEDLGTVPVEIQVMDSGGQSSLQAFTLTVTNVNDAPRISSVPDSLATEDHEYSYQVIATDPDPTHVFRYFLAAAPAGAVIDSSGLVTWTPPQEQVGRQSFRVRVVDEGDLAAEQQFAVRVEQVDEAPWITSQADTVAWEDSLYSYAPVAMDEEGGEIVFSLLTAPSGAVLDSSGHLAWIPRQADVGIHTLQIQAMDPEGLTAVQSFDLRVQATNDAPVIRRATPTPDSLLRVPPHHPVLLSVQADDEESDPLTFTWERNGSPRTEAAGTSFEITPSPDHLDTIRVHVTDGVDSTAVRWIIDGRALPHLSISAMQVDFGAVALGDTGRTTITLTNSGYATLELNQLAVEDLRVAAALASASVEPGEATMLTLRYAPSERSALSTRLSFHTNDPQLPMVEVEMQGTSTLATATSLDLDPTVGNQHLADTTASPGAQIDVAIYLDDAFRLVSGTVRLAFDPSRIRFVGFAARTDTEPCFLDDGSVAAGTISAVLDDTLAVLRVDAGTGAMPASGSGLLGVATFAADSAFVGTDSTSLRVLAVVVRDPGMPVADTLTSAAAVWVHATTLAADFDGDGVVDLDDFFLFAEHFGTTQARFDLDGGGTVDFEDFFLFAEQFGRSVHRTKRLVVPSSACSGTPDWLQLHLRPAPSSQDVVLLAPSWAGPAPLTGYALTVEFAADLLEFRGFTPAASTEPLTWVMEDAPGRVRVAAAVPAGKPFHRDDLGYLSFGRHGSQAGQLSPNAVVARIAATSRPLANPPVAVVAALPATCTLLPPYPNPFNPETTLQVYLPEPRSGCLSVYDLLGRRVRVVANGPLSQGHHRFIWNGRDDAGQQVAAGVYFVELRLGEQRQLRKLLLLK